MKKKILTVLLALCATSLALAQTDKTQGPSQQGAPTPENRLIQLRHQLEQPLDAKAQRQLIADIAETGTFVAMMTLGQQLDNAAVQKQAARGIAAIALAHPEYDGHNTRQLLARAIPFVGGK